MLCAAKTTDHSLTFSLLLWYHGRWLWERLANLAISSRISSCREKKGREEKDRFQFWEARNFQIKQSQEAGDGLSRVF